jgi:DNA-binding winged helix-turn-helix (wHTH) protein
MQAEIIQVTTERSPDCTDACVIVSALVPGLFGRRDLLVCNREVHYQAGARDARVPSDVVVGSLSVSLDEPNAYLDGRLLSLTYTEWALLAQLARRVGRVVPGEHLLFAVWGEPYIAERHILGVNICRLRRQLGPGARYIHNAPRRGYCLALPEDYVRVSRVFSAPKLALAACRDCGRADVKHKARGRCRTCDARWRATGRPVAALRRVG